MSDVPAQATPDAETTPQPSSDRWRGARVLVTGAGGFIGSHLTERLVEAGARVRAFVHYNALGRAGWLDGSPHREGLDVVAGDICDRDMLRAAAEGSEVIFHLAALIGIPYSYRAPASYLRTNVEGTMNVLQAARDLGVARVIHTSTSEVYGTARHVPIPESHVLQAQSPYSASKIAADKMAEAYHHAFGVPVVTVRPFNTYGPRQSARAVIPTIISQCLDGGALKLGSLHPTRDFLYVGDTVGGFLAAAAAPTAGGRTINLGTGAEISIRELVELIGRLTGTRPKLERDDARVRPTESEVDRLLADTTCARTLLGWRPRVSLEQGLTTTIAWIREHLDTYRVGAYTV